MISWFLYVTSFVDSYAIKSYSQIKHIKCLLIKDQLSAEIRKGNET